MIILFKMYNEASEFKVMNHLNTNLLAKMQMDL